MATIEIDGKKFEVEAGKMIIEVADEHAIHIPRFCYHKKLSVAANCRMCLVEVEKSRKPLPACATPVTDGMKVFTRSKLALEAQRVVMEFLLVNHPLDCPICDQGGECELQDVSMGYGNDKSFYSEGKRAVDDDDLGPLISSDMTRCIHCMRCVRFGDEIAGVRELGATGRGESTKVGTYVKHTVSSPVSANVIDLCPVGALTNKPARYKARAWEMRQAATVAPHDCLGTNMYLHTRSDSVIRAVPRENEAINETWLSDRDRYSLLGMQSGERLLQPEVKTNGVWQQVSWPQALQAVAERLKLIIDERGANKIAAMSSPSATIEEAYLLQKWMRLLGSNNIDHRLRQTDFADQAHLPLSPQIDCSYQQLDQQDMIFLVGSNIEQEQPLAGVRVRKAALQGAKLFALNPMKFDYNLPNVEQMVAHYNAMIFHLAAIAKALGADDDAGMKPLLASIEVTGQAAAIAQALKQAERATIVAGAWVQQHPNAAILRSLLSFIAKSSNAHYMPLTDGANATGAWLAGCVPHRRAGGEAAEATGLDCQQALAAELDAYILHGVEPEFDCANPQRAIRALTNADCVVSVSPFVTKAMRQYADILLPSATFAETSGTFVNLEGTWQSFGGAVTPAGEARPAWKIFRVLGNLFDGEGFDYNSSQDVLSEVKRINDKATVASEKLFWPEKLPQLGTDQITRVADWPTHRTDNLVRRSKPLQDVASDKHSVMIVNEALAKQFNLRNGRGAVAIQNGVEVAMPVRIDESMPDNCVYVVAGAEETADMGDSFGQIDLK